MNIFNTIITTKAYIRQLKLDGLRIGFVPTMGALHPGHISLIERARLENDVVGCSIFINPIQFNNKEDLEKYPRTFEDDAKKLVDAGCHFIFHPGVEEMYPEPVVEQYDFGRLDKVMEGAHRPGHFNGVAVVVNKLFEIIEPGKAYFGMKDYQQLRIIQTLTEKLKLPVEIISCPTIRENDGLAMSSRNVRLSRDERKIAPEIYRILMEVKEKQKNLGVNELENWAKNQFAGIDRFRLEYFEIVDSKTLLPIHEWSDTGSAIACTAVFLGGVRLIDNLILF
jgi:pantoate--beta-alanine ligase